MLILDGSSYRPWVVYAATLMWLLSGLASLGIALFVFVREPLVMRLLIGAWGLFSLGMAVLARAKTRVEYSPLTVGGLPVVSEGQASAEAEAASNYAFKPTAGDAPRSSEPPGPAAA